MALSLSFRCIFILKNESVYVDKKDQQNYISETRVHQLTGTLLSRTATLLLERNRGIKEGPQQPKEGEKDRAE